MAKNLGDLTDDEGAMIRRGLAALFTETDRTAKRNKWRPSERAATLASIEMLYERVKTVFPAPEKKKKAS